MLSKVYPTRSHSGAAQGGCASALGNMMEDHWEWHLYDTVRGSDFLGDQDAQELLVRDAVPVMYEMEHLGVPVSIARPRGGSPSAPSAGTSATSARPRCPLLLRRRPHRARAAPLPLTSSA